MYFFDMLRADKNAIADNIINMAFKQLSNAESELQKLESMTIRSMEKLANRKKMILAITIKKFIHIYERMMAVDFIESDNVYPLNHNYLDDNFIDELRSRIVASEFSMNYNQIIYTYLVGTLKGRSYLDIESNIMLKKSEYNPWVKNKQSQISMDDFYMHSEKFSLVLAHLNLHFRTGLDKSEQIIDRNGNDRTKYSDEDKQCIRNCLNLADTINLLIDAPMFNEAGILSEKSLQAILQGNESLLQLNRTFSEPGTPSEVQPNTLHCKGFTTQLPFHLCG